MPTRRTRRDSVPSEQRLRDTADRLRLAVRRQDGKETPIGRRAQQTRSKLLAIATEMFADRGYLATSLGDIAQAAGVSLATLYQYFSDRSDIVAALAGEAAVGLLGAPIEPWRPHTGRIGLRRSLSTFAEAYHEHRTLLEILRVGSHTDRRLDDLRRDLEGHFQQRFAASVADGIEAGLVRDDLPREAMARTLMLATFEYCHDAFVFDPEPGRPTVDDAADVLAGLWADAIGLVELGELRRRQR